VRLRALGLVAWEEVDGTHELVLDPEADGDGQRADLIGLAKALRHLHTDERVANPHLHADHPLELGGEAVQVRGAAREHDLAYAERVRLRLVDLERGDELAREVGDLTRPGI